jgi:hypothetical protein
LTKTLLGTPDPDPTPSSTGTPKVPKHSSLRWVRIADLRLDPEAQRDPQSAKRWAQRKAKEFDPDQLGYIVASHRADGNLYVIDGWHRIELLRAVGWGDQQMQAEVFDGTTQAEDAARFLGRNDRTNVRLFDKFRVRVTAADQVASDIDRIARAHGLTISDKTREGYITAVAALERVYRGAGIGSLKDGPKALSRTLTILQKAWGNDPSSFQGALIEAMGLVCLRYGSTVDDAALATKLASESGGAPGVIGKGRSVRDLRSRPVAHCIASVIVDLYNKGRRSGKLEDWWA